MQITFKLYATLGDYLPASAKHNRIELDITAHETPETVIERHQVPKERAHLVLLNGIYLNAEQRRQQCFKEGDTLAVWPPIAGG